VGGQEVAIATAGDSKPSSVGRHVPAGSIPNAVLAGRTLGDEMFNGNVASACDAVLLL
jgi:hypothetical protein